MKIIISDSVLQKTINHVHELYIDQQTESISDNYWLEKYENYYKCQVVMDFVDSSNSHCLIFDNAIDATLFLIKWS